MKSMTGYGEAALQGKRARVAVQIRSLNHRHLDIQIRVPREYLAVEEEIRKRLRQRLARGRVEIFISRAPVGGQGRRVELDEGLLRQYLQAMRRAKKRFGLKGEADLSLLHNLPELFQLREEEAGGEDEKGMVLQALESALKKLEQSREREGRRLRSDIELQMRGLRRVGAGLTREAGRTPRKPRELPSSKEGIGAPELQKEGVELGNWTNKGDIHEEVVRFKSHVTELARLTRGREPVGKKMDFFLQEIQRELNTISSKAPQIPIIRLVLSGKEGVEKIREQAQNIE